MLEELMAARLPAAATFALTVAVGCAQILEPILRFIEGISPRNPVLDAAVAVVLVTLPATYLIGVLLVYLHVTPPARGALRRFADLACTLALALLVALSAFLFLAIDAMAGSPSSPTGFTPT